MEVVLESGTGEHETSTWAFVKEGSLVEFGAQAVPQNHPTKLVVVWRAAVATKGLRSIVGYTCIKPSGTTANPSVGDSGVTEEFGVEYC